jgi:uncharacterized protein (TIGR02466 family)
MKYKAHSLFPIPVLDSTIEVSPKIINYVHSLVYERTDYDNADISVSKNILDNVLLKTYSDKIDSLVNEFVFEVCKFDRKKLSLKRVASWSNVHHYSDWAQEHIHMNSFVSGVWYLKTSEDCGDLQFHNPHIGFGKPLDFEVSENNGYNSDSWNFSPQKNKIYIFPSTLRHSVDRNETKKIRTSIAFNYYANGIVESEDVVFKI